MNEAEMLLVGENLHVLPSRDTTETGAAEPVVTCEPATPRNSIGRRGPVPKRRFQKGHFKITDEMAYSFFYEDAERADGTLYTRKVRHFIGRVGANGMSERAAEREHDRIMREVNLKRGSVAPTIKGHTFLDSVNAWRKDISDNLSPASVRAMESHLKIHILPRFAESGPHDLNVEALQQFATSLCGKLSRKTIENVLQTIASIIKYAAKRKIQTVKVSLEDLTIGDSITDEAPYFTPAQSNAIINEAPEPYKTMFTVAALTGIRAGELLALYVSDLDFSNKTISITKTADNNTRKIRVPKTRFSKAKLPMPSVLEAALKNYLENHWKPNDLGLLFPNHDGTRPRCRDNTVKYILKPILRKLNISTKETGFHAWRHGLATELAEKSAPVSILQAQLRHADVRTTMEIYAHLVSKTHRECLAKFGQQTIGTNVPISTNQSV